jgi:hypothetical protein
MIQSGETEKHGWWGTTTVVLFFVKNSLAKKKNRKCEMVHCHDATASSFVT